MVHCVSVRSQAPHLQEFPQDSSAPNFDLFGISCRKAMRDRERNEKSYRAAPHASLVGHVKTGSPLQWYRLLIDVDPPFCCNGAKKTHLLHDDLWGSTWCTI